MADTRGADPIPGLIHARRGVLAPGSERIHAVVTLAEFVPMAVPMYTSAWAVLEDRWVAVTTGCGRRGPFEMRVFDHVGRQRCRACQMRADAWDGYRERAGSGS